MTSMKAFKSVSDESLDYMIEKDNFDAEKLTKRKKIEILSKEATSMGIDLVISQMKVATLNSIASQEPDVQARLEKKSRTKATLSKYLRELIVDNPKGFFENASVETLEHFLDVIGVEAESKKREELADQVIELVKWNGVQAYFSRFDVSFLKGLMEELNLDCTTDSTQKIATAIADMTDAESTPMDNTITFSKKKLPIAQGVTYQDIYQHYYVEELVAYCEEEGLVKSGNKKELIHRILEHLENDGVTNENAKPKNKAKKSDSKPEKSKAKTAEEPEKKEKSEKSKVAKSKSKTVDEPEKETSEKSNKVTEEKTEKSKSKGAEEKSTKAATAEVPKKTKKSTPVVEEESMEVEDQS